MKIEFNGSFIKKYRKRILPNKNLHKKFKARITLFNQNFKHPLLKDHPLAGDLIGHRAFSITGDVRIIYFIKDNIVYFVDIGTHNQVY